MGSRRAVTGLRNNYYRTIDQDERIHASRTPVITAADFGSGADHDDEWFIRKQPKQSSLRFNEKRSVRRRPEVDSFLGDLSAQ